MAIWRQKRVDSACLSLDVTSERWSKECRLLKRGKGNHTVGHRERQRLVGSVW
jgi:hypothetical protein